MQWKGLAVIATVLLIAFGMALGNRFYQNQKSGAAVAYWGKSNALVISQPDSVEVWQLERDASPGGSDNSRPALTPQTRQMPAHAVIRGSALQAASSVDLSDEPGLMHLRRALLGNASYNWEAQPQSPINWRFALLFTRDDQQVWLLLSEDGDWIAPADPQQSPAALRRNKQGNPPFLEFVQDVTAGKVDTAPGAGENPEPATPAD